VKLDVGTLATVPADPPAAGPDLAFDPAPPGTACLEFAAGEVAVVAVVELLVAVALTMP
jgi:hypothetical protein